MEDQDTKARTADPSGNPDEELTWKAHLLDAQRFDGTDAEYCELHGLKLRQLRGYKRKFGVSRKYRPRRPKAFVKVECAEPPRSVPEPAPRERPAAPLPDPKWLAELILALASRR